MSEKELTEDEIYAQIKERIKGEFVPLFTKEGIPVDVGYNKTTKLVFKNLDQMVSFTNHHTEEETRAISEARRMRWDEESAKKEQAKFDKAEKKKFSEWSGEQFLFGDTFYIDIGTFLDDMWECHGENYDKYPKYVWETKKEPYITEKYAFDVYENDLEEIGDDCDPTVHGVKVLQMALDAFVDVNKENILYWPDYSLALLIDDEIEEYRKRYED